MPCQLVIDALEGAKREVFHVETKIPKYRSTVDSLYAQFKGAHHQQPGDPARGVSHIIDVMNSSATAEGRPLPISLTLEPDAVAQLRKNCADTFELMDE